MREIDLIPVRFHKVDLTWDLVDELLEDRDEMEADIANACEESYEHGYQDGVESDLTDAYNEGYDEGYDDARSEYE